MSRSSTKSEYKALAIATDEIILPQYMLDDLGVSKLRVQCLWCANLRGTYLSTNIPIFHVKTKHIKIHYHFVRERVANKLLIIGLYLLEINWWMDSTKPLSSAQTGEFQAQSQPLPVMIEGFVRIAWATFVYLV